MDAGILLYEIQKHLIIERQMRRGRIMGKKWVTGILCAGMAVSLAACGQTKSSAAAVIDGSGDLSAEQVVEIAQGDTESADTEAELSVKLEGNTLTAPEYTAQIPESWNGLYEWEMYEEENGYGVSFANKEAKEKGTGGILCSIQVSEDVPIYIEYIGGDFIGELQQTDGDTMYYLSISYPTGAQFDEDTTAAYNQMTEGMEELKNSIQAADGWELVSVSYEEVMANYEQETYGVMVDASMHSFTMVDYTGQYITFSGEDIDASSMEDGVQPGHCYKLTYKGVLGYDGSTENAAFVSLQNVDADVPEKDYEASYVAAQVLLAFHNKDISYLAGLCRYPLTMDDTTIQSVEDMEALDFGTVISEDLLRYVNYCDLYDAEITGDSFQISVMGDKPCVTIEKDAEGIWAVTGIYNNAD